MVGGLRVPVVLRSQEVRIAVVWRPGAMDSEETDV